MPPMRLIVNPTSGRGTAGESLSTIRKLLSELGVEHGLVLTERPWHAAELARAAVREGCEVVVAVGGDGTANEVLNGLMLAKKAGEGQAALGVLCVGRGNDMAFGLRLPKELEAGCATLAGDNRRTIDVGLVRGGLYPEGRYFGNGVGIGFDAVVGFEALKMTRLSGFVSYLVAALKTIFLYFKAPTVEIEAQDLHLTMPALMVSVMNGRRMGGGFMMAPDALTDDGLFDLCIAREVSKARIFALIARFMAGTQASHPSITTARSPHISVRALEGVLPAHADGETLCTEGTTLELVIQPAALEIVCPAHSEESSS